MIRCWLGHNWNIIGGGDLLRNVDNKPCGEYRILQCTRCGKLSQRKFS